MGYIQPGSEDLLWFLGYNPDNDIASPGTINLLGPEVFRRNMRCREIDTILEDSTKPFYGIIITAFDYQTPPTSDPVALWQTRIGLPANGKSMASALPTMLVAAGPARAGTVKLGELKFIENLEKIPPPETPEAAKKN